MTVLFSTFKKRRQGPAAFLFVPGISHYAILCLTKTLTRFIHFAQRGIC